MNFFKEAKETASKMFKSVESAINPASEPKPPVTSGLCEVVLTVEGIDPVPTKHKIHIDVGATVAHLNTQIYLITTVVPARQRITGFRGIGEGALLPDYDLRKAGLFEGAELTLTQLPPGQEIEPCHSLTSHPVDKIAARADIMQQRVDSVEAAVLVQQSAHRDVTYAKLHKLCMFYADHGMKLLLKVDELDGGSHIKVARKALVTKLNGLLDRLEKIKARISPNPEPAAQETSETPSEPASAEVPVPFPEAATPASGDSVVL